MNSKQRIQQKKRFERLSAKRAAESAEIEALFSAVQMHFALEGRFALRPNPSHSKIYYNGSDEIPGRTLNVYKYVWEDTKSGGITRFASLKVKKINKDGTFSVKVEARKTGDSSFGAKLLWEPAAATPGDIVRAMETLHDNDKSKWLLVPLEAFDG